MKFIVLWGNIPACSPSHSYSGARSADRLVEKYCCEAFEPGRVVLVYFSIPFKAIWLPAIERRLLPAEPGRLLTGINGQVADSYRLSVMANGIIHNFVKN